MIPVVAAHAVGHGLWREPGGIVEARCMDSEQLRHGRKGQVDRRAAARAETACLYVAAVSDLSQWVAVPVSFTVFRSAKVK